ncbi:D-aminoacyl-tRNA deacylase-like [Homarus americanus]|uniref:D-aminoacyl-tRNA deacylase n=1 Tax=Homarus americanus TaxID=6706 RepID=A0A8J5JZV5_HOMAM|nr:D-aminoacyl-tRNA deacylase-like [Homarus americanus]KAG7162489.1 D-aminoacyl-tRNA deacylase 1-like [Homarus americanus]
MRVVIQRVHQASVTVGEEVISSIGRGLCVLVGIHKNDTQADVDFIVRKILNTRLFEDGNGKRWQLGVKDAGLEVLTVSQFTLYCELKGNKPDYRHAMSGEAAQQFYENFVARLQTQYKSDRIFDGKFGAMMQVTIQNDGPVTINIDSPQRKTDQPVDNTQG